MRAVIRELLTPDIDPDTFVPDDPDDFAFLVQMIAGPSDGDGAESFDFTVCTPAWLRARVERDGPTGLRHHVVVAGYHWPSLRSYFERLTTRCWGADWPEVATKLARYGHWEFEE